MKHHHPEIFCAAILNAQPMGFYAPAQLVRDAREHDVEVRPVCVNASRWDCTLEPEDGKLSLRLGLRMVKGLSNDHGARIAAAAMDSPFTSVEDVWRRSGVPAAALEKLADADAFHSLGLDRRQALWRVRGLGDKPLPLFAAAEARENEPAVTLTPMTEGREVVEDYRSVQLSLRAHPLAFLRRDLDRRGVVPADGLKEIRDGRKVQVAGVVLVRQRPGAGNVTWRTRPASPTSSSGSASSTGIAESSFRRRWWACSAPSSGRARSFTSSPIGWRITPTFSVRSATWTFLTNSAPATLPHGAAAAIRATRRPARAPSRNRLSE
jgi:DNA polymerase III alpha subunit